MRDKLLGVSGKEDIDIALDNMAGNDFAIALNKWNINKGTVLFFHWNENILNTIADEIPGTNRCNHQSDRSRFI